MGRVGKVRSSTTRSVRRIDMSEAREERRRRKAERLVEAGCVKHHVFTPSGRELWTVVGSRGDLVVDDSPPFCACIHFNYRVLKDRDDTCVHLVALELAKKTGSHRELRLDDEEYGQLLRYLLRDFSRNL